MERGSQFPDDLFHATTQRFKYGDIVEPRGDFDGSPLAFAGSERDASAVAQGINTTKRTGAGNPTTGRKARVYKVVPVDPSEATRGEGGTSVRSSKGFKVVRRARKLER
jgi:hypothetical protein